MNGNKDSGPSCPAEWLDRLVDGELTETERAQLLIALEHDRDGWRRCALAFLESQSLRDALRDATPGRASRDTPSTACPGVTPRSTGKRSIRWSAVAASFLIAFTLGITVSALRRHGETGVPSETHWAAGLAPTLDEQMPPDERIASQRSGPLPDAWRDVLPGPDNAQPWRLVSLADTTRPGHEVTVPCLETPYFEATWLDHPAKNASDAFLHALSDASREVRHVRRHLVMPTDDGRTVIVPIDQIDVRWRTGDELQ